MDSRLDADRWAPTKMPLSAACSSPSPTMQSLLLRFGGPPDLGIPTTLASPSGLGDKPVDPPSPALLGDDRIYLEDGPNVASSREAAPGLGDSPVADLGCEVLAQVGTAHAAPPPSPRPCALGTPAPHRSDSPRARSLSPTPQRSGGSRPGRSRSSPASVEDPRSVGSRFASPPIHYGRTRTSSARALIDAPRPRNLGEFLAAAKSRTDDVLEKPPARRRQLAPDLLPRRSSWLAGQASGLNSEQRAHRVLLRKLGVVKEDEVPSTEAIGAYRRLFEVPLEEDMVAAILDFWCGTSAA